MSDTIYPCGHYKGVANAGWFGYKHTNEHTVVIWEGCRDRIQAINADVIEAWGLWFCHRKDVGNKIKAFIEKIETTLKLEIKSIFGDTEFPDKVLWMKPAPFWMLNLVRRSFLTLALRAGQS